jgi:hypothetical protein
MPKRADWIARVRQLLRDRMIPGSEVRAYVYAPESVREEMP